ncbi:MAG: GWxTD domain-containing protein [Acidobacteria bacterium]|nr:GWxTD domain-containing protein [Acidobacteriota bacterium]
MNRLCVAVTLLSATIAPTYARGQAVQLDAFERVDVESLPAEHRDWLEEYVAAIITDDEREVFLRMDTDARRDSFIQRFWEARDPSPGTPRNEYRELYAERYEYVKETLGRTHMIDAWRSDMGRVYLLLGRPQSMNRLPNTSQAVPVEVWFYNVDPALGTPPFFYLIFFKDRGVGDYRLYSPAIDGPDSLLNQSGQADMRSGTPGPGGGSFARTDEQRAIEALRKIDPELGNAAASLVPGDAAGVVVSPLRSEMVLSRLFEIPNRLMPSAPWAYRLLAGDADADVRFETLSMTAEAHVLFDPSGLPFAHFATRTVGDELNLNNYGDDYYVTFEIASSLRDGDLRVLEDRPAKTLQASLDEDAARRLRGGPVQYIERMPLLPGSYALDVMLENNLSRRFARSTFDLRVPNLEGDTVEATRPVLAFETNSLEGTYDRFQEQYPYQVGERILLPAVGGAVAADSDVTLYWQVYVPDGYVDPLQLIVAVTDTDGNTLLERSVRLVASERGPHGLLTADPQIDLTGFTAGDYQVDASIEGTELRYELPLKVVAASDYVRPFVHGVRYPPAGGVDDALARAAQRRVLGQTDAAMAALGEVLRRDPDHAGAFALQIELLTDAGRFTDLADLIRPRLVDRPNDAELLLQMAAVHAQLGEHYDAIRYYERSRLAGAEETLELLNALASEYYADGNFDQARELFERSLEVLPDQPQIRRVLEEVLGQTSDRR